MKTKLLCLVFCFTVLAAAQTPAFDPDPSQPGAQQVAEMRWGMSLFGILPPPIGWVCRWVQMPDFPYSGTSVECQPDPSVIAEQERQQEEWEQELARRAREFYRSLGRQR